MTGRTAQVKPPAAKPEGFKPWESQSTRGPLTSPCAACCVHTNPKGINVTVLKCFAGHIINAIGVATLRVSRNTEGIVTFCPAVKMTLCLRLGKKIKKEQKGRGVEDRPTPDTVGLGNPGPQVKTTSLF